MGVIKKLYSIINHLRGFEMGYSSKVNNMFMLDYEDERYLVTLTKIENPDENMLKDIDRYINKRGEN